MFTNSKPVTRLSLRTGVPLNHIKVRGLKIFHVLRIFIFSDFMKQIYVWHILNFFLHLFLCRLFKPEKLAENPWQHATLN